MISLIFVQLFSTLPAFASTHTDLSVSNRALSWYYYNSIVRCASDGDLTAARWNWSLENIKSGNWFDNQFSSGATFNSYPIGGIGETGCSWENSKVVRDALSLWGVTDPIPLYCEIGIRQRENGSDCVNGTGDFKAYGPNKDNRGEAVKNALLNNFFDGTEPHLSNAESWYYHSIVFMNSCSSGNSPTTTQPTSGAYFTIGTISSGAATVSTAYVVSDMSGTVSIATYPNGDTKTCDELAELIQPESALSRAVSLLSPEELGQLASSVSNAENFGNQESTAAPTCAIAGIGWILCPVVTFLAGLTDATYNIVADMLAVRTLTLDDRGDRNIYNAWNAVRSIANVAFVIVFLIVIYSQLTSVGLSNYGIKKLLPKLIIAAILVNISYWVCALLVDLSNLAGFGIKSLFESIGDSFKVPAYDSARDGNIIGGITATVLTGAVVGATLFAALGVLLPALVAIAFTIVGLVVVLTLRQALVVLIIVIAPLAFVAYLLPNTESLFKKWWGIFKTMLLMFPVIALVFAASALSSKVITNSAGENVLLQITGAAVAILPLITIPMLIKTTSGVIGKFMQNNPTKGIVDHTRNAAERRGRRLENQAASWGMQKERKGLGRFMTGSARRKARGSAIDASAEQNRKLAEQAFIADQASFNDGDNRLATDMARGSGERGINRVLARAEQVTSKDYEEEVAAAKILNSSRQFTPGTSKRVAGSDFNINSQMDMFKYMAATGKTVDDKTLTEAEHQAAVEEVMGKGNYKDRRFVYQNSSQNWGSNVLQSMNGGYFKSGDQAILGAAFGEKLRTGTAGGERGINEATMKNILDGKVGAASLVRDADATSDIAKSAAALYGQAETLVAEGNKEEADKIFNSLVSLSRNASQALENPQTSTEANKDIFKTSIDKIVSGV